MERSRSRSPPRQRDPLLDLEYDQLIELYAKTSLLIQAMSAARFLIVNAQRELGDESIDPRFHEWAIAMAGSCSSWNDGLLSFLLICFE